MLSAKAGWPAHLEPEALFGPVAEEQTIGLAVSGGPDSLALMVLYAAWRRRAGVPRAIVYTVDHGLREAAAAEARLVQRLATARGLEARILHWSGPKPATGVPAAARAARYRLIGEAMARDGAGVLLTAHHLDDQAETVLMRLAHGSGATGLGGMRAFARVEGVNVFRPLLGATRQMLAAIVAAAGLEAVEDPSNADTDYERARWRVLRPDLERAGLTSARLARFAERMQRLDALAERSADALWKDATRLDEFGAVHLAPALFEGDADEAALRVLSRAVWLAGGGQRADLAGLEELYGRLRASFPVRPATLMGAVVASGREGVLVYREAGRRGLPVQRLEPGDVAVWDRRFIVEAGVRLSVGPASTMTRRAFCDLAGQPAGIPVAALRAAPLVSDMSGRVLALGTRRFGPGVAMRHVALT